MSFYQAKQTTDLTMQQGVHDPYFETQNLASISPNNKYSGFGVILDTTRGIRVKNNQYQEYSTQIKIIDSQLNPNNFSENGGFPAKSKQYITFFIYWTSEEHQPFSHKIGDIIRFVQFDFENYNSYLQGKNRKGASWAIFHGDSSNNEPYCQSDGYKERMTQFHVQRLHELRQWINTFFEQNLLRNMDWYSYERHLEAPSVIQSFDMLLRVEEIRMPPGQSNGLLVTFIDDKLRRFKTHVSAIHGRFLKEGDVVKLRSIERVEGDYLKGHNRYFAVLGIPSNFKDYKEFVEVFDVQESQDLRGSMEIEDSSRKLQIDQIKDFEVGLFEKGGHLLQGGSTLSSGVALCRRDIPKRTALEILRDLEAQDYDRIISEGSKYQLRATLIDIRPKSLAQSLRNECKTCHVLRKLDAPEGETCCQRKMEKTMLLRLLWQDQSLTASRKLLVSYITPGQDAMECLFPDFPLKDVNAENMEAREKLWGEIAERYLEDDRLFDILLEPIDNEPLRDRDGQVPLRLTETLFVPVLKFAST